jgi:chemotaxis protein histidine kinase CheA
MDLTEFLGEFQLEAGEKLDTIATQLLKLERDATNPQPLREMFLAAHTIKGGAAMMRLTEVEALAHALEDLLSSFRDEHRTLDGAAADLLFQAIDRLRSLVAAASGESVGAEPDAQLLEFARSLRSRSDAPLPVGDGATRRALVVDDSATVRELHRMVLEEAGYVVEAFSDGHEAVARAGTERFDVVVAGVQSDGLNGFDVASAVHALAGYLDVPILLTSADSDREVARKGVDCGARAVIRKGSLRNNALGQMLRELAA